MALRATPAPIRQVMTSTEDAAKGLPAREWSRWFVSVYEELSALWTTLTSTVASVTALQALQATNVSVRGSAAQTGLDASVPATAVTTGALSAGLYRLSVVGVVTTADGVSSSLAVSAIWTSGGVTCSTTSDAATGNTIGTAASLTTIMAVDAGSSVRFATTYGSNTPGQMKYRLSAAVERVT